MPILKLKLRQLKGADVSHVSLVERAANRIPFRVIKSQENQDMIDLSRPGLGRILKGEKTKPAAAAPAVSAIVVTTPEATEVVEAVTKAITESGLSLPHVVKNEDGTTTFATDEQFMDGASIIRLSDKMLAVVKGFEGVPPENAFVASKGFFPSRSIAAGAMGEMVTKGDPVAIAADFQQYVANLTGLPEAVAKADELVHEALKTEVKAEIKPEGVDAAAATEGEEAQAAVAADTAVAKAEAEPAPDAAPEVEVTPEVVAKAETPAAPAFDMAALAELVTKAAGEAVAKAIAPIAQTVAEVQAAQEKTAKSVDEAIRKSESSVQQLKNVVVGGPEGELSGSGAVKKSDYKPLVVDTAYNRDAFKQ